MKTERYLWYVNEIKRLKEIDNMITEKIQNQLNTMDQKKKEKCKKTNTK